MMENQSQESEEIKEEPVEKEYSTFLVLGTKFQVQKRFQIVEPLGSGAYGSVVSARDTLSQDENNNIVAIKKIEKAFEHVTFTKRTLRQIKIMRLLDHENVIKLQTVLKPRKAHQFEDLYLVYELMETDLGSIIKSPQELSDQHAKFFIYQILRGMKYVHSAGLLHRDLKPKNVLVNQNCDLKICDFGLSRADIPELQHHNVAMTDYVATRWYRAPQILLGKKTYSKAIDVWSIGLILAELLIRKPLLPGNDTAHQIELIVETIGYPSDSQIAKIPNKKAREFIRSLTPKDKASKLTKKLEDASPMAIDLVSKMLKFDPQKRITVQAALEHPFINELHDPNDEPLAKRVDIFDFEFEKYDFSILELKALINDEINLFNSEKARQEYEEQKKVHPEGILSIKFKPSSQMVKKRPRLTST